MPDFISDTVHAKHTKSEGGKRSEVEALLNCQWLLTNLPNNWHSRTTPSNPTNVLNSSLGNKQRLTGKTIQTVSINSLDNLLYRVKL